MRQNASRCAARKDISFSCDRVGVDAPFPQRVDLSFYRADALIQALYRAATGGEQMKARWRDNNVANSSDWRSELRLRP
jgi:hypothetical protein